jgi:hypothetical protein
MTVALRPSGFDAGRGEAMQGPRSGGGMDKKILITGVIRFRFAEGTCLSNFLFHYKWRHVIPNPPTASR